MKHHCLITMETETYQTCLWLCSEPEGSIEDESSMEEHAIAVSVVVVLLGDIEFYVEEKQRSSVDICVHCVLVSHISDTYQDSHDLYLDSLHELMIVLCVVVVEFVEVARIDEFELCLQLLELKSH